MTKSLFFKTFFFLLFGLTAFANPPEREFYEIKIYTVNNKEQEMRVEQYLKDAYIPALHRMGIKTIGVFKPVVTDTVSFGKLIYVLTPIKNLDQLLVIPKKLNEDAAYLSAGKDYIDAGYKTPPYARFETIVLQAFPDAPMLNLPKLNGPKSERIYELRSYEGHTEKIHQNKVKMFNAGGEVKLFTRLGFNAVFYGQVISGSHQPNLMYMTTFENKASRDAHWKAFGSSPEWTKLKADPEYLNNMLKNTSYFMFPTDYSDL
jgi:NIPSNAP